MRLRRRAIRTQARTEKCSDSIFAIRAHRHDFGTKQQPAHPANGYPLDFHWLILIRERDPNHEFHAWYDLVIAQHTEPVPAQIHHRSFSKKISTHVIHDTTNGNPVVGANHELIGVRHVLLALSQSNKRMFISCALNSMEQNIRVAAGSSLAHQERGPTDTLDRVRLCFGLTVRITTC